MRRSALAIVTVALAAAVTIAPTPPAADAAPACEDGVLVVVDKTAFGGDVRIGCAPGRPDTGLAALQAAGFGYDFVPAVPGMVCRIDELPDPCNNAPTDAYWSYHHAERGGSWSYSQQGAGTRTPPAGSVEGWAFGSGSAPSVAPPPKAPAKDDEPSDGGSGSGGSGGSGSGSGGSGGSGSGDSGDSGSGGSGGSGSGGSGGSGSEGSSDDGSATDSSSASSGGATASDPSNGSGSEAGDDASQAASGDEPDEPADEPAGSPPTVPEASLPEADTRVPTPQPRDSEPVPADDAVEEPVPPTRPDEVALDAPNTGGRPATGVATAGALLTGIAGIGVLQHRRRRMEP